MHKKFIEGLVEFIAPDLVLSISDKMIKTLDRMSSAIDKKTQKKLRKFMEQHQSHASLFVERIDEKKSMYYALNEKYEAKYRIAKINHKGACSYVVMEVMGKTGLGSVNEIKPFLNGFLSTEENARKYEIMVGGHKIGEIKSSGAQTRKITLNVYSWSVGGNVKEMECWVLDNKGDCVMLASMQAVGDDSVDAYLLEMTSPQAELVCLLIALAVDLAGR